MWRLHTALSSLAKPHLQQNLLLKSHCSSKCQTPALPVLTLYTKERCQLCDEAKATLLPISHRFTLEEVDITLPENKEWRKYRFDIPVFHFSGEYLMKHRVNLPEFEQFLTKYENINGRS